MQFEVKDLISRIKKDGLEEAERLASEIVGNAKREAEAIVLKAESDARELKIKAEKEVSEYRRHALEASRQAVRDLIIGTEKNIKSLFETALKDSVSSQCDNGFLSTLIVRVVEGWSKGDRIDVILNESDLSDLLSLLRTKIGERLKGEIEVKPFRGINKGFKIQQRDSNLYYDFTTETISDILFEYLNPRFKEVIKVV
ncbi:V-type ATP synthase subunit E [Borrelia turcica IST7]|uniref:V-type ATP synthase subunit E n=1 Tax=Borrelia turcica IST7 TaxID=1104446 RepID=A0A386PM31_9SPIR|nr:V-type ATP synthase subunit E [Borrelia turcica]AYE35993.1 V-type ATP synthase subunit E [Borrelia turcica IST7]